MAKSTKSAKKKIKLDMWVLAENLNIFHHTIAGINGLILGNKDIPSELIKLYSEIINNENEIDEQRLFEALFSKAQTKSQMQSAKVEKCAREILVYLESYAKFKISMKGRNPLKVSNFLEVLIRIVKKLKLYDKTISLELGEEEKSKIFKNVFEIIRKEFTVKEFKQIKQGDFLGFDDVEEQLVKDRFIRIITCVIISKHYFNFKVDKAPEDAEDFVEISKNYLKSKEGKDRRKEKLIRKELDKEALTIGKLLDRPMKEKTLIKKLCDATPYKERKIERILNDLVEKAIKIPNKNKVSTLNIKHEEDEYIYFLS